MRARAASLVVVLAAGLLAPIAGGTARAAGSLRFVDLATAVAAGVLDAPLKAVIETREEAVVEAGEEAVGPGVTAIVHIDHTFARNQVRATQRLAGTDDIAYEQIRKSMTASKELVRTRIPTMVVLEDYESLGAMLVELTNEADVLAVLDTPGVSGIRVDAVRQLHLGQSLPFINQPAAASNGSTGAGTYVAVLDSGVDFGHSAFGSCPAPSPSCRVEVSIDIATNDGQRDSIGHGTNVSAIVAGVAPAAKLLVLDVVKGDGNVSLSDELRAIDWVIGRKQEGTYNIKAANMSFGAGNFESPCADTERIADLLAAGIMPVAAAGNEGYAIPVRGIGIPACIPGALSVGAVYDANYTGTLTLTDPSCTDVNPRRDQIVCFSSASATLSMLAPGYAITAGGSTRSGTSMATPHVAGAVAALASVRPDASVEQLRAALLSGSVSVFDSRLGRNFPRLDLNLARVALIAATGGGGSGGGNGGGNGGGGGAGMAFTATPPFRLLDSRDGTGGRSIKLTADTSFDLTVVGQGSIPNGITAIALNVTVDQPDGPGVLTVGAGGASKPPVSNLNYATDTIANAVIAPVSSDGKVRIFVTASTHVIVDAQGFYGSGSTSYFTPATTSARLLDTRSRAKPGAGEIVDLAIAGVDPVPADATAVVLNVTAVEPGAAGYVTVFPTGGAAPLASSLNYSRGRTVPNLVVVKVGAGGALRLLTTGSAHLVVDLAGWFRATGNGFTSMTPARVLDTRNGTGGAFAAIAAGGSIDVFVTGAGGVPSDAAAVVVNVTVTEPSAAGHLTVSPSGATVPTASNLNYTAALTVANLVVVKVGVNGQIRLTSLAATHAIVDVQGWYRA